MYSYFDSLYLPLLLRFFRSYELFYIDFAILFWCTSIFIDYFSRTVVCRDIKQAHVRVDGRTNVVIVHDLVCKPDHRPNTALVIRSLSRCWSRRELRANGPQLTRIRCVHSVMGDRGRKIDRTSRPRVHRFTRYAARSTAGLRTRTDPRPVRLPTPRRPLGALPDTGSLVDTVTGMAVRTPTRTAVARDRRRSENNARNTCSESLEDSWVVKGKYVGQVYNFKLW